MYHVKCVRNDLVRFTRHYINGLLLLLLLLLLLTPVHVSCLRLACDYVTYMKEVQYICRTILLTRVSVGNIFYVSDSCLRTQVVIAHMTFPSMFCVQNS